MKKALVTGITGQDGSYLADLLLGEGYEVHGLIRRSSSFNTERIDYMHKDPQDPERRMHLHYGDITDAAGVASLVKKVEPDEIYNLAAQSHVRVSFDMPGYTFDTIAMGTLHCLEAMRSLVAGGHPCRMYQASSSEMFGSAPAPQSETTPFAPQSPYAVAKVAAHQLCANYRDAYGLFISCGILFNHESPRRGLTFVTRKITRAAARIKHGLQDKLYLGNLDAIRDWGHAMDYVRAMYIMLQKDTPHDYVIATGSSWSVREWLEHAFRELELDAYNYVELDKRYLRPTEVDILRGDATKARKLLGWQPTISTHDLLCSMVRADEADVRESLAGRAPLR